MLHLLFTVLPISLADQHQDHFLSTTPPPISEGSKLIETKRFWKPHVVIAEDSEMMARTISRIVQLHCDVVRVVRDGQSAINAVLELQPDVLVLDIQMPVLDGIQVVRRLKALELQESDCYAYRIRGSGIHRCIYHRRG